MFNKIIKKNEHKELNPIIEKMSKSDIKTVMEIESKSFNFPWRNRNSFLQYVERGDAFVVHIAQDIVVGYVLVKHKSHTIELYKMAIDPNYRRKGLGRFTVNWIKEFVKDQGLVKLLLRVRASNCHAIELYRKTGFQEIRKIENYYKKTGLHPDEKAAIEMQWVYSS